MPKVRIEVSYLEGVEDPEALTIFKNLKNLGYNSVDSLKVIRVYELDISDRDYEKVAKEIGENLMVNPVIHKMEVKSTDEGN